MDGRDVCECGDYRSQHFTLGPCRICRPLDLGGTCPRFRLFRAALTEERP